MHAAGGKISLPYSRKQIWLLCLPPLFYLNLIRIENYYPYWNSTITVRISWKYYSDFIAIDHKDIFHNQKYFYEYQARKYVARELTRYYRFTCTDVFTISHDGDCSRRNYVLVYSLWDYCRYNIVSCNGRYIVYTMFTRADSNVLIEAFAHSKLPSMASGYWYPLARNCYQVWQSKFIIIVIIVLRHTSTILSRYDYTS